MKKEILRYLDQLGTYFLFEVHYEMTDSGLVEFNVYPASEWSGSDNTHGVSYFDKHSSDDIYEFNNDTCRKLFDGSYRSRGVWEGRIYFGDDEYWSNELMGMAILFEKWIEPQCKIYCREYHSNSTLD